MATDNEAGAGRARARRGLAVVGVVAGVVLVGALLGRAVRPGLGPIPGPSPAAASAGVAANRLSPGRWVCPQPFPVHAYKAGRVFYRADHPSLPPLTKRPERCFTSSEEAEAAGYRRAPHPPLPEVGRLGRVLFGVSSRASELPALNGVGVVREGGEVESLATLGPFEGSPLWLDAGHAIAFGTPDAPEAWVVDFERRPASVSRLDVPARAAFRAVDPLRSRLAWVEPCGLVEECPLRIWSRGEAADYPPSGVPWRWHPDGRLVVSRGGFERPSLELLDLSTGRRTRLFSTEQARAGGDVRFHLGPVFSHDGELFAATVEREGDALRDSLVLGTVGSGSFGTLEVEGSIGGLSWSPVSNELAYTILGGASTQLVIHDAGSGAGWSRTIAGSTPGGSWSPDGAWILVAVGGRWDLIPRIGGAERVFAGPGWSPHWCCTGAYGSTWP